jgi:hypothetical protein
MFLSQLSHPLLSPSPFLPLSLTLSPILTFSLSFYSKETGRWQDNGRVIFDLSELPQLEEYYFLTAAGGHFKPLFKICRLDLNTFLINRKKAMEMLRDP